MAKEAKNIIESIRKQRFQKFSVFHCSGFTNTATVGLALSAQFLATIQLAE
jgi:Trk-type K+ transport system membrane component